MPNENSLSFRFFLSYLFDFLIERRTSKLNGTLEVRYRHGKLILNSATANYSYDSLHRVFQRTFKQFKIESRKLNKVLILGFGAGSVAAILYDELKMPLEITGVEHDPAVIELAEKYFNISRFKGLSLFCKDAAEFVLSCREKFDFIVVDLFNDSVVPEKFSGGQFVERLSVLCSVNGMICFNYMINAVAQQKELQKIQKYFSDLGMRTEIFAPMPMNKIVAAFPTL